MVVGLMSFQAATLLLSWVIVRVEFGNKRNHLFNLPFGHKNLGAFPLLSEKERGGKLMKVT